MSYPESDPTPADDLPLPVKVLGFAFTLMAYAVTGVCGFVQGLRRRTIAS